MAEQYIARDKRTGLEIAVTGEFPPHPDDRIRIARTTNLFARLMATILSTASEAERREQFIAIETQLEMAEALIRGDFPEVQQLLRKTMERMGIGQDQLDELARRILDEFGDRPDIPPELRTLFGDPAGPTFETPGTPGGPSPEPEDGTQPGDDHADEPAPSGEEASGEDEDGDDGDDDEPPIILGPPNS